ncbi:hypothetical protein [Micromonospora sp. ATCC 39149]|uniref:Uncharacterized protein n=1 Tax=Micromonospora carbonacea TaxID=47853 RepID=A0A7D6C736_9ACTN|nr:hypothetical protein [Micromonospora sp. ATCC 39149]QLJ99704.1 hypothetical protein HZU44_06230 [Micromonospora carbonacea]
MRIARALAGMLLLTIGIPALLAAGALGVLSRHPDAAGGFTVGIGAVVLQARPATDWFPVAAWLLGALGALLVASAVLLLRPARPREVVFVVEPDQVPVLADRLGVTSLDGLGARPAPSPAAPVDRQLVAVGASADRPRSALAPAPARRPATLADLTPSPKPASSPRSASSSGASSSLPGPPAWPPVAPEATTRPVRIEPRRIRPAAPSARTRPRS